MGKAAALAAIAEDVRGHRPCDFEPCATAANMVPGEGSADAALMLVGEAPGATEDREGRPFVGSCGRLLDDVLASAGIARGEVFITNVVKARPPGNRDPRREEVEHCWPWLRAELEVVDPAVVVPLGRHALRRFAPGLKISDAHGRLFEGEGGRRLFPLYHPAAALRSRGLRTVLERDARRLGELVRKTEGA